MKTHRNTSCVALFGSRFFLGFVLACCLMANVAAHAQEQGGEDILAAYRSIRAQVEAAESSSEKIKLYDRIVALYADIPDETVQEGVAWAMLGKAEQSFGRNADGLYAEIIAKFQDNEIPAIRRHVVRAQYKQALRSKNKSVRIQTFDKLLAVYRNTADPDMQGIVDDIAFSRANTLNDAAGVITICDGIISRLADKTDEDSRSSCAWAMQRKAVATQDTTEKVRLFDAVIVKYRDDPAKKVLFTVERTLLLKAEAVPDKAEKIRILDELLAWGDGRESSVWVYVNARVKLVPDNAGKQAIYESLLSKYGERLSPRQVASMMYSQAMLATTDEEQYRQYDRILERFGDSNDESVDFHVVFTITSKIRLSEDKNEKLTLYDALIARCRHSPDDLVQSRFAGALLDRAELVGETEVISHTADEVIGLFMSGARGVDWSEYARAVEIKVSITGDESIRNTCYDVVIMGNFPEYRVVDARFAKAEKAGDKQERLRLFDELIARHQDSDDDSVATTVLRVMSEKAKSVEDEKEKITLLRTMIEKPGARASGSMSAYLVDDAIKNLVSLTGDKEVPIRHYDEIIRTSVREDEVVDAMMKKSDYVDDAAKMVIYDDVITRRPDSIFRSLRSNIIAALQGKASLTADKREKTNLYERIVFGLPDKDAESTEDGVGFAFWSWYELTNNVGERRHLIDRYLAEYKERLKTRDLIRVLQVKAELADSTGATLQAYDELIAVCRDSLAGRRGGGILEVSSPSLTRMQLASALSAKAKIVTDSAEKVKLYDEILTMANTPYSGISPWEVEKALKEKAALTGDASTKSTFFKEHIRTATTDSECAEWYSRKAEATDDKDESRRIRTELAAKFVDSADAKAQALAARALVDSARAASNSDEAIRLYNSVIEKFGNSDNPEVASPIVRALMGKARLEKGRDEKLKLYDGIIEKYLDSEDFIVRDTINSAIAERFRLLDKAAAKP